jgi:hypothetical protein
MSTTRQAEKILVLLRAAHGAWVPLPEIMACAAQYNARVFDLRGRGLNIENRTETMGDGSRHSWFRLVDSPAVPAPTPSNTPPADDPSSTADWFEGQAGKPRPAEQSPDLGPLFETVTHG